MQVQNSYSTTQCGKLYVVPTPIGNLDDITIRALETLKQVDYIAAEDTRHTKKLLMHFDIKTSLISYHEHNERERTEQLLAELTDGNDVALVSDAGMPAISDPGHILIQRAIDAEVSVIVLPGANAALCALVGSGLSTSEFLFYGFLPRKKRAKEAELTRLNNYRATVILYESPYRLTETLKMMDRIFGRRNVVLVRELTKLHEQYVRGTIEEVLMWLRQNEVKGECCIVIDGNEQEEQAVNTDWWQQLTIVEHVNFYEKVKNVPHTEALKRVAVDRNVSRRDVYESIHVQRHNE